MVDPRDYHCPYEPCSAEPGDPCKTAKGFVMKDDFHYYRGIRMSPKEEADPDRAFKRRLVEALERIADSLEALGGAKE